MFKIAIRATALSILLALVQPVFSANADNTATETVNSFEKLFGVSEGKRRNHTKGFCFDATLTPVDPNIHQYSTSALFTDTLSVKGRLSHKGGNHAAADNKHAEYGMGLAVKTPDGSTHLMAMNTLDFFPVATPQAFAELMRAKAQGGDAVKKFKQKNTDLQRFKAHGATKPKVLKPYEGSRYNSINSFYLINGDGIKTAVRWSFVPTQEQALVLDPKQDFFFENMQKNLNKQGIAWDMLVTLANEEDDVNNAAIPWTGEHKQIVAARLTVSSIATEEKDDCDDINYDPLVLSAGFQASDDPLLQARRDSYAVSFGRRILEKQQLKNKQ